MRKLSNIEPELKKSVANKKSVYSKAPAERFCIKRSFEAYAKFTGKHKRRSLCFNKVFRKYFRKKSFIIDIWFLLYEIQITN